MTNMYGALLAMCTGVALIGQIEPSGPVSWVTNIGGLSLATLLVWKVIPKLIDNFTAAMKSMTKDHNDAINGLTTAITSLRIHCAARIGEPAD